MSNEDLCYLTATRALGLFRKRKLSPVELTKALIARAERINPKVNCLADCYFEEALEQAKLSEARYMKRQAKTAPLEGIALAVKDAQRVAGKRTTQGSLIFKDAMDDHSDPMIERLQKAGAIVLARTTTPEFCLSRHHLLPHLGCHAQSLEHGVGAGRLIGWLRCGAGRGPHHACNRHGYRRVHPHSGRCLRRCRLQAAAWPQSRRTSRQFRPLQPLRSHDAQRCGRGADAEHNVRAAPARP